MSEDNNELFDLQSAISFAVEGCTASFTLPLQGYPVDEKAVAEYLKHEYAKDLKTVACANNGDRFDVVIVCETDILPEDCVDICRIMYDIAEQLVRIQKPFFVRVVP